MHLAGVVDVDAVAGEERGADGGVGVEQVCNVRGLCCTLVVGPLRVAGGQVGVQVMPEATDKDDVVAIEAEELE
jgi:hypothetical protein